MPAELPLEIVIVDDEVQIRRLLRLTLEPAGYRVRECETGAQGLSEVAMRRPDAVILDLSLPDLDGVEVLRRLRDWTRLPVLVLSVRRDEVDKIAALDAGADDYLTKPFGGGELLARLRAILRRVTPAEAAQTVRFGDIEVDFSKRSVTKKGEELHLTMKEYALLRLLLQNRGKVLTHGQLLREVWGLRHEQDTHYLRVHMANLRKKIGSSAESRFLRTESGIGYRFLDE